MKRIFFTLLAAGTLPLAAENLLNNSSFELGTAGYQICNYVPLEGNSLTYNKPQLDSSTKIHGKYSLKCDNPRGEWMQLISHEVKLEAGKEYTVSAWMKSSVPLTLSAELFTVAHQPPKVLNQWYTRGQQFQLTPEWKRYSFTLRAEEPYRYPFLKLSWNGGTVWFDALQINPGKTAEYTPSAELEFAISGAERIAEPGKQKLVLKGINYTAAPASADAILTLNDTYFEKNIGTIKRKIELPAHGTVDTGLTFPSRNGVFRADGTVRVNGKNAPLLPFDFGVAPQLPAERIDPDTTFTLGYSSAAGAFRNPQGRWEYRALGMDYDRHYANLRRQGIRINRLHDDGVLGWETIEPEPGKYDFRSIDNMINTGLKYGIETMPVIGGKGVLDKAGATPLDNWHIRKNSRKSGTFMGGRFQGWLPPEKAWSDFVYNLVKHCKGRVRYYEIVNEPNLYMTPENYTRYLKLAWEAAKKADPSCRIVGICSTGDLGGQLGEFVEACGKLGAFRYLDILSFHPYSAQLDSFPTPAEDQIREVRKIVDKYRKNVPLWNSELYYIKSNLVHQQMDGQSDWIASGRFPARNTAKRYLIDLGSGLMSSISLNGDQFLHNDLRPHFGYSSGWATAEMIPNAHYIAGNAFARFLEGAKSEKQLKLLNGINGWRYKDRNGGEVAAFWAKYDDEQFRFSVDAPDVRIYDMFGNEIPDRTGIPLTADPYYLTAKNLDSALASLKIIPNRLYSVTGAQWSAQNGKRAIAVELKNNSVDPLALTVRIKGHKDVRRITLNGQESRTLFFPCEKAENEITVLVSAGETVESVILPLAPRKFVKNGETVRQKQYRFQVKSDAKVLNISVDVRDGKRGARPAKSPWEGDCIELFLDARPAERLDRNPYTDNVFRLFVAPKSSNGLPEEFSGSNIDVKKLNCTVVENGTDYSASVTIPWNVLRLNGPAPIGFDITVNNSDGEKRDSAEPWAGNAYNWRDRFNFGIYVP